MIHLWHATTSAGLAGEHKDSDLHGLNTACEHAMHAQTELQTATCKPGQPLRRPTYSCPMQVATSDASTPATVKLFEFLVASICLFMVPSDAPPPKLQEEVVSNSQRPYVSRAAVILCSVWLDKI